MPSPAWPSDGSPRSPPPRVPAGLPTAFGALSLLVVGDLMVDQELDGTALRQAPDAPVPVIDVESCQWLPGGAANAAVRAAQLGASVAACGVIGTDPEGARLEGELRAAGVGRLALVRDGRPTTVKTRVRDRARPLLRVDRETRDELTGDAADELLGAARGQLGRVDAVVISDYGKGAITRAIAHELVLASSRAGVRCVVDSKAARLDAFAGSTVLKVEERALAGGEPERLAERLEGAALLVTMGRRGSVLHRAGKPPLPTPALARWALDVAGAGDALCAALALALAAGEEMEAAVRIGAAAAAIAVESARTRPLSAAAVEARLRDGSPGAGPPPLGAPREAQGTAPGPESRAPSSRTA